MSQSDILIRRATSDADREATMRVRFEVFVDEQQVPAELEPDEYDAVAIHLLALERATDEVIGTARLVDKGNGLVKIGRVAIRRPWRGRSIGDALMRFALDEARTAGFTTAALDAQTYVIPFYEKLGFVAEGPIFDDAGIPHRHMRRSL